MIDDSMEPRRLLLAGECSLNESRLTDAIALFREALALIGRDYWVAGTLDSTETRILRAEIEETSGRFSVAANLLMNALASRIAMLDRKLNAVAKQPDFDTENRHGK